MNKLLGDLEEKIMKVVWESETPLKPSQVQKALKEEYAYTTIMTVMSRLSEKQILKREQNGKAFFYSPAINKDSFVKPRLKKLFSNLIGSYGDLAINQFIDTVEELKEEDIKKLKDYLNSIDNAK